MTYLDLFLGFLKVGCFAFGGGYGAVPLVRDVVLSYGWLTDEQLTYMIAISESTPGPIMVNMATYVGSSQGGFWGAALATFAVVLPAFFIIIIIACVLKNLLKSPYVQAVLQGMHPCIAGIIPATGIHMLLKHCLDLSAGFAVDWYGIFIAIALFGLLALYKKIRKKKLSPILLIVLSAILGILVY